MSDEPKTSSARNSKLGHRKLLVLSTCFLALAILGFALVRNQIDFPVYYAAGRSLLNGRTDLYSPDFALGRVMDYRYPPFFLLAFSFLWALPYSVASWTWYVFSTIAVVGCLWVISRVFGAPRELRWTWLLVGLAVAQYFVMALHYGNAHLLSVLLLFASFYCFLKRRDLAAAALLSLSISIKLIPILLLPYFAVKRRWALLAGTIGFLAIINLAPSLYFGFRGNTELLAKWYEHVVASQEFHEDNGPINLSLKGQLRRYLTSVDYSRRVDGDTDYPSINLASLSRQRTDQLWMLTSGALSLAVLLMIFLKSAGLKNIESGDRGSEEAESLELGIIICLMLFVGPLTSKIYFIALLWPVACLADFASRSWTRLPKLAVWVLGFIVAVNSVLPLLPGRSVQRLLLVLGVDFYVNLLLMVALIYALVSRRRAIETTSSEQRMPALSEARTP